MEKPYNKMIDFFTDQGLWIDLGIGSMKITGIILISMIFVRVAKKMIRKTFELRTNVPGIMSQQRERRYRTILRLLQSVISYVVYFSAILAVL